VTITGTGLSSATTVSFGANAVTPTVVNDGTLTVTVPAGAAAGPVGVTVTTGGGSSNGLTYTYVDGPTVTTVDPTSGPDDGGTGVTITGTNLSTTQSVTFGGTAAPFSVVSDTTLSVVTPPHAITPPAIAEAVDVVVTTTGGTDTVADGFTYLIGPGI
jgi:hypothetical protein